jgi:serine O-acetyltransferase
MNKQETKDSFYRELFRQQKQSDAVPSNKELVGWSRKLICLLFPQLSTCAFASLDAVKNAFGALETELVNILNTTACFVYNIKQTAARFFEQVTQIYRVLHTDIEAIIKGDPAAHTPFEVIRADPGFYALSFFPMAHVLYRLDVPVLHRMLTELAHSEMGIDIRRGAVIGEYFCIVHCTGIVIGETSEIGKHVKLYQGVTLGALSLKKKMAFTKKHPTVQDDVVIYAGATIRGGDTLIGHNSIIGGNVWLTESLAPGSLVYHSPEIKVVKGKYLNI